MVLSKDEEMAILKLKEQYKIAEREFQLDYLKEEHKLKMERLKKMHEMVKDGWKGVELK